MSLRFPHQPELLKNMFLQRLLDTAFGINMENVNIDKSVSFSALFKMSFCGYIFPFKVVWSIFSKFSRHWRCGHNLAIAHEHFTVERHYLHNSQKFRSWVTSVYPDKTFLYYFLYPYYKYYFNKISHLVFFINLKIFFFFTCLTQPLE